ncbi:MerR family transcriptional regulator [Cytobacillus massiliigabonensis]|uniref:MerR family transcriptional regulator n=1 Tax=Cytobacillus massiliigabonensis TaxID=1871011 RepID=UPI000C855562|nr:MerR family transcriptional regulator [Cytobacillus massiliigabonensis]
MTKSYAIKEAAKKLSVSPGKLRQWEKELEGLLVIPRTKQGARYYTDDELSLLETIKQLYDKSLSKDMIRGIIEKDFQLHKVANMEATLLPAVPDKAEPAATKNNIDEFLAAMKLWKDEIIGDVRDEIRHGVRKEVIDEVKKEILKGSVHTVKSLSDSIYKSNERTITEIDHLSSDLHKISEHTSEKLGTLSKRIAKSSKGTTEQIRHLSHRVADSSEAAAEEFKTMIHYISSSAEVTHTEISALIETLNTDREFYLETIHREREEYWKDVNQREVMFQDMILSFRSAAAAEEKKEAWWKFWK